MFKCTHESPSRYSLTQEEAALAQSNFNVEKITEIQSRFTGGEVGKRHTTTHAPLLFLSLCRLC